MRRSLPALAAVLATGLAVAQGLPGDLQRVVAVLQPAQRTALEARARRWAGWSATQRDAFAARARAWATLTPAERGERRAEWAAWRQLPPAEQAQLREAAARYAALDPLARQTLRTAFDALDASVRRGWRLGPVLGADYPRLQPLLAQVPPRQVPALLRTLRAMSPIERERLAVLVQRTPPQAREALRRDLVSTSDSNRGDWLLSQLDR